MIAARAATPSFECDGGRLVRAMDRTGRSCPMRSKTTKLAGVLGIAVALSLSATAASLAASKQTKRHHAPAHTAHARASQDEMGAAQPGDNGTANLRGYSQRPNGMCWEREGGGGQDLSGFWKKC